MISEQQVFELAFPPITAEMTKCYGEVNNDANAIHYDASAAAAAGFQAPVVHGAITAAIVHRALTSTFGEAWSENGSLDLRFLKPVWVGSALVVRLKIERREALQGSYMVTAGIDCISDGTALVLTGRAKVRVAAAYVETGSAAGAT